jgi:hypothetical protein
MQWNPNSAERQGGESWLYRPGTVLLLILVIEVLLALMGFADGFTRLLLQVFASIASVLLVGVIVNQVMARRTLSAESESDQTQFGQHFNSKQRLLLGVLLLIAIIFYLPIWHQHGDFAGHIHGHPIWAESHVH